MRLAWALVAGALGAAALAWWLARGPSRAPAAEDPTPPAGASADARAPAARMLYRWRDDDGVVHVTDVPPSGRDYTRVDIEALKRRNTLESAPAADVAP